MITIPWVVIVLLVAAALAGVGYGLHQRGRSQHAVDAVLARELARPRTVRP